SHSAIHKLSIEWGQRRRSRLLRAGDVDYDAKEPGFERRSLFELVPSLCRPAERLLGHVLGSVSVAAQPQRQAIRVLQMGTHQIVELIARLMYHWPTWLSPFSSSIKGLDPAACQTLKKKQPSPLCG